MYNTTITGTALTENTFFGNEGTSEQEIIFAVPGRMNKVPICNSQNPCVSLPKCSECEGDILVRECERIRSRCMSSPENCLHCQWLREPGHYGKCLYGHNTESIKPKHHTGNGKPKGIFAGTLTMSPKWETNEEEMCEAIKKIMRQKTTPVKRYVWYLEYTKDNVPHIHFIYETHKGGRITQQTFKRQWKYWDESTPCGSGHVGGYHKHCAKEDDYLDYISKDKGRHENKWTE